jgi:hypothetical protein
MQRRRPTTLSLTSALTLALTSGGALPALALVAACSSSSSVPTVPPPKDAGVDSHVVKKQHDAATVPDTSTGGGSDAHPDVILDPQNCVSETAKSSENGIGGYCSPKGGQCLHAGTGGTPTLCSADFGAPAHEWFCTLPCNMTSQCGAGGGTCISAPFADICVPAACTGALGDASSQVFDAGDATTDGPPVNDAAPDHDAAQSHDSGPDAAHDGALIDAPAG